MNIINFASSKKLIQQNVTQNMQTTDKYAVIFLLLLLIATALKAENTRDNAEAIPDSLLTEKHITRLYLNNPDQALHLLDEAEQRRIPNMEPFRINLLRSMVYGQKGMHYLKERYVRQALASDSVRLVPKRHLRALSQLVMALEQSNKYEEGIRTAEEAVTLARQLQQSATESEILSIIGRMYVGMARTEEGIEYMTKAINRLQNTEDVRELAQVSTAYGDLMSVLCDDGQLQKAIEAGQQRAEIIRRMSLLPGPPPGYIDQQYGYLYSKMAYFYLLNGQVQQAEEYFNHYLATNYAHSLAGQGESIPYLLKKKRYHEAIEISKKIQTLIQGQDTVNYNYLIILDRYAQAYRGLQQYALVDAFQQRITTLTNSIYAREKSSRAHEFAIIFDTQEKEAQITRQDYQISLQRILLYSISFAAVISLIFLWINCKNLRKIREKNRVAFRQIDEMMAQRERLRRAWQGEGLSSPDKEQDLHIFQKMENTLLSEKTFLNHDYRRENLMELTRMNKNRLTELIKECTGTTPNTYINHLRIEYAVKLMKTYPHYSIESIAADSGFKSKNTFYVAFRDVFGVTPNEYKKGQENKEVMEADK